MEEMPRCREHDEYAMYLKSVGYGHVQNLHGVRNLLYEAPQRSLVPDEHHGSTWVADRTIDFLKSNRGRQPFFCWSSWIAPHPPFNVPHSVADLYRDRNLPEPHQSVTPRNEFTLIMGRNVNPPAGREHQYHRRRREVYYAQITYIDQQIGRIYDTLQQTGLLDNTLIIFTSDHGEMLEDHGANQKAQPYDGAARIPFIVRYPPAVAPGTVRDDFVDLNDILPTALDVAGVNHPDPTQLPGASIFRDDKDRSIQYFSLGTRGRRWACVRDARFKYTYYYGLDHDELFDMQNDPGETTNLLATSPQDPDVAQAERRLRHQVIEHERRWGPADACIDEHGQLRRYPPPPQNGSTAKGSDATFPRFPTRIVDPDEYATLTPFAEEAIEATRHEPLVKLHQLDLSTWRAHGASDSFLDRIHRDDL